MGYHVLLCELYTFHARLRLNSSKTAKNKLENQSFSKVAKESLMVHLCLLPSGFFSLKTVQEVAIGESCLTN
jgi:hypothetical protein